MSQLLGEIKLFAYDDVPAGWIKCAGQSLEINKYPKLYMMLGTKFGQDGKFNFKLPDLREKAPAGLVYCIAIEGELPRLQDEDGQAGIPFIESAKEEETLTDGELEMVAGGITNIERDQLKEK